ncbi:MAG: rhamnulose-1-phosphate aldolase [Bacteroidota bacterium]
MIGNFDNLLNFSNDLFQKKELKPVLMQVAGVAQYLWERGWAERNAGNFSVNVTGFFHERELDRFSAYPFFPLSRAYPGLPRTLFLVSGTGTRMRDMAVNPAENLCFVYISDTGSAFHVITDNHEGDFVKPTSELVTHLAIHQQLLHNNSPEKAVLHAHVTELIALTQLLPFKSGEAVNSLLWGMHPETLLFVPDGVGFVPYTLAGTEHIAAATTRELEGHKAVLWEKHGCLAIGSTLADAFDILDILAKSAKIYLLCKSTGMEPEGLSAEQLNEIRNVRPG